MSLFVVGGTVSLHRLDSPSYCVRKEMSAHQEY